MTRNSTRDKRRWKSPVLSNEEEDQISKLPDAIILHILSFLGAKDVVKSGILSKRFAYLWTEVSCLDFLGLDIRTVNDTLYFHKLSNLEMISVISRYYDDDDDGGEDDVEYSRLFRRLNLASVKDITLEVHENRYNYTVPQHFCLNPSLEKLSLQNCGIRTNGFVNWKSLQKLSLSDVQLFDNAMNDVLSGCPALEELGLFGCSIFIQINFSNNRSLSKLEIRTIFKNGMEEIKLEIPAPNLQSLVLSGFVPLAKCRVSKAESLTNCYLAFHTVQELHTKDNVIMMLTSLLEDLSHIEVVTIGEWVLQVLSLIELNGLPCPMSKTVKCLTLHTNLMADGIAGMMLLLRGLNCLEKLSICVSFGRPYFRWFGEQDQERLENKSYWASEFDLKLKTIKIGGLEANQDLICGQNHELSLVKFLLKNSKFMENMIIVARGSEHYLLKLSYKLLGFPRGSPRAVVEVIGAN